MMGTSNDFLRSQRSILKVLSRLFRRRRRLILGRSHSMKLKRVSLCLVVLFCWIATFVLRLGATKLAPSNGSKAIASEVPEPRAKNGKKLLTSLDLMKVAAVSAPRLSPDGTRVAYLVSETKMEKDKEWKAVGQIWVTSLSCGDARQFTRSEKSASAVEWSPDGKMLAFLTDREKDGERQVWMMMADGGEAWAVTTHKGGVSGFRFSPDGKSLLLTAADQPSKEEEDRKKVKDDTMVIDMDIRMTHLWLWNLEKKDEKRLTEGKFTISDPQWSPDGTRITYITRPTPKADDGNLSDVWMMTIASGDKKKISENVWSSDNARWSPDGKWIAFDGGTEPGAGVSTNFLYLVPAGGGPTKQLTSTFDLSTGTPVWSRDGKTIYFSTNALEAIEVYAADVSSGAVKQLTKRGGSTGITEISRDGKVAIGTTSLSNQPTEIYQTDAQYQNVNVLTNQNAWLNEYALASTEIVKWKSKDGTEVE